MNAKKKLLSALFLSMVVLLAACGSPKDPSSSSPASAESSAPASSASSQASDASEVTDASSASESVEIASVDTSAPDASLGSTEPGVGPTTPEQPVTGNVKDGIEITPEENAVGSYFSDPDIGFKFFHPDVLTANKDSISIYPVGSVTDEQDPIYAGYNFEWLPSNVIQKYNEITSSTSLTDDEKKLQLEKDVWDNTKHLYGMLVFRTNLLPQTDAVYKQVTGFDHHQILKQNDQFTHVFAYNDVHKEDLNEADGKLLEEMIATIPTVRDSIGVADPKALGSNLTGESAWEFETVDLDGKAYDQSVLQQAEYTMINVWATWCGPCVKEIPDIAKISDEYQAKGLQVIGFVTDVSEGDDSYLDTAKKILTDSNAKYLNLKASDSLNETLLSSIRSIPTTFIVDKTGKILGEFQIGSLDADGFRKFINDRTGL